MTVTINAFDNETTVPAASDDCPSGLATKARLTDRDRQLIGLLAVARYLSTEQLSRLLYAGRNIDNMRKRFLRLAGQGRRGFKPPYIRHLFCRTYQGQRLVIWALTNAGYAVAENVLGITVKISRHDVSSAFREHTIVLNEVFVALMVPPSGGYARAKQNDFRWIPSDTVRLPWRQNLGREARTPDRLILPDAVLEIPSARRRFFLECEMGSHPILPKGHAKPGSTIAKIQNYESFLRSYVDAAGTQTFYARAYPDNHVPEVLFVVRTPHRAQMIKEAICAWQDRSGSRSCAARALTVEAAQGELLGLLRRSPRAAAGASDPHTLSLRAEDLATMRAFYNGTVVAFKEIRARARARKELAPAYPPLVEEMQALVERLQGAAHS